MKTEMVKIKLPHKLLNFVDEDEDHRALSINPFKLQKPMASNVAYALYDV